MSPALVLVTALAAAPPSFNSEAACRDWIAVNPGYITCIPILSGRAIDGQFLRNADGSLRWEPMLDPAPPPGGGH